MGLSPHKERNRTLLIKVTRFAQWLQMSKDFLSPKERPGGRPGSSAASREPRAPSASLQASPAGTAPPPPSLDPGRGGGTHPSEGARGREASAARRPQGLRPVLPSTCLRGREEAEKVSKGVGREGEGEGRGLSRSPSCLSL